MRFEEQVMALCGEALAADDAAEVRAILAELRLILHQRIEHLRGRLHVAYPTLMVTPESFEYTRESFEYTRQFEAIELVSLGKGQDAGD
jgi:hypothetical protein